MHDWKVGDKVYGIGMLMESTGPELQFAEVKRIACTFVDLTDSLAAWRYRIRVGLNEIYRTPGEAWIAYATREMCYAEELEATLTTVRDRIAEARKQAAIWGV